MGRAVAPVSSPSVYVSRAPSSVPSASPPTSQHYGKQTFGLSDAHGAIPATGGLSSHLTHHPPPRHVNLNLSPPSSYVPPSSTAQYHLPTTVPYANINVPPPRSNLSSASNNFGPASPVHPASYRTMSPPRSFAGAAYQNASFEASPPPPRALSQVSTDFSSLPEGQMRF